jgi:hypothetical protein
MSGQRWSVLLLTTVLLAACGSQPPPPPAPTAAQQQAAQAAEKLTMYEQLRSADKGDLAAEIGADIVAKFPGTPAAAEVAKTLPELQRQAKEGAETRRLERLWSYQESPVAKGKPDKQFHVSIYAKGLPTNEGPQRVTLFIRQHPEWGQSTYLMRDESGFLCARDCALTLRFDGGKPERWAATIPPTGEPAIFIDKNEALVARLLKSKTLSIDTEWKDQGKKTLEFELAGLKADKLPPAKKK